jgi:hypothetical protein
VTAKPNAFPFPCRGLGKAGQVNTDGREGNGKGRAAAGQGKGRAVGFAGTRAEFYVI